MQASIFSAGRCTLSLQGLILNVQALILNMQVAILNMQTTILNVQAAIRKRQQHPSAAVGAVHKPGERFLP
ncbi:MAG: hypothetical protein ACFB4J_07270 [Elainellaceae cyanobacterium]